MKATLTAWPSERNETLTVDCKRSLLWWQERGLTETATGYGNRLTSQYVVRLNNRWRRVYICCYSNSGTAYIGKPGAWEYTVDID